uniref:RXLR phytopathogen effector protein WY-domain domain-containing protein n=1 Tax=Peronospora matthiolae TaxID=2874970 RepID=A0AAV1UIL4_9STRA
MRKLCYVLTAFCTCPAEHAESLIGNTSITPDANKNASDPHRLGHTYALVADTNVSLLQTLADSKDLAVHGVNRKGHENEERWIWKFLHWIPWKYTRDSWLEQYVKILQAGNHDPVKAFRYIGVRHTEDPRSIQTWLTVVRSYEVEHPEFDAAARLSILTSRMGNEGALKRLLPIANYELGNSFKRDTIPMLEILANRFDPTSTVLPEELLKLNRRPEYAYSLLSLDNHLALEESTNTAVQWLRYVKLCSSNEEKKGEFVTRMVMLLLYGKDGRGVDKLLVRLAQAKDLAWIAKFVDGLT